MAFGYAVYTSGFVMVTGDPRFAPEKAPVSGAQCPETAGAFPVPDDAVLADDHMVTGYVSEAVLQCMLWALAQQDLLQIDLRDGDIPNVRSASKHRDLHLIRNKCNVMLSKVYAAMQHRSQESHSRTCF